MQPEVVAVRRELVLRRGLAVAWMPVIQACRLEVVLAEAWVFRLVRKPRGPCQGQGSTSRASDS